MRMKKEDYDKEQKLRPDHLDASSDDGLAGKLRRVGAFLTAGSLLAGSDALRARQAAQEQTQPLLTLDQDRLFLNPISASASIARERQATARLKQENKRIEAELVAEEQALTEERKTLSSEDFAAKAEAFDQKVERIRAEQDAKARDLTARLGTRTGKAFLVAAVPVLGEDAEPQRCGGDHGQGSGDPVAVVDRCHRRGHCRG
jgi:hypothetical protein